MTEAEAMRELQNRYDCEIYQSPWGVNIYYKDIYAQISFEEKIQKWGNGTIWQKHKQLWSTGEFAERRKLTTEQLFSVLDVYLPIREQMTLF